MGRNSLERPRRIKILPLGHGYVITSIDFCGTKSLTQVLTSTVVYLNHRWSQGMDEWLHPIIYNDVITYPWYLKLPLVQLICQDIIMTSSWARWRLKSPAPRLFTQPFVQARIKENTSSASLAFVRGIHRWPVNSPHKGSLTRKCFYLMTSSWKRSHVRCTVYGTIIMRNLLVLFDVCRNNSSNGRLLSETKCCGWVKLNYPFGFARMKRRDPVVYAPSQWEATLQRNVVSHWLGACTKWSLINAVWSTWHCKLNRYSVTLISVCCNYVQIHTH